MQNRLEVYRDSTVKTYEILEDLTWKLLSKIFRSMGLEINNPRGCYKQAFKESWNLLYIRDRIGEISMAEENKSSGMLLERLKEEKAMSLKGGIYHTTQIKFAYNTNHIEGSKLSEEQTRYIYETNTIVPEGEEATSIDDITETINHFQCFDYMIDCAEEILSEEMIKKFHLILKSNTSDSRKTWFNVGEYKSRPNVVGGSKTTAPSKVSEEIQELLTRYNSKESVTINDIIEFHHDLEAIHPFQDGNGRVGRLIMFKECLKNHITPFIIEESHKMFYYRGLKEFKSEKGYLIDTCLSAQDHYEELVKYFMEE